MKALRETDPGRVLIFALSLVIVGAVAAGGGFGLRPQRGGHLSLPAEKAAIESVRGVVQSVTADSITIQTDGGPITLKVPASTLREAIQKTSLASIKPGDWVNAGGVHHDQSIYALTALVVIPAADLESGR